MSLQKLDKLITQFPDLQKYRETWAKTARPTVALKFAKAQNLPRWASKLGGKPYLPVGADYPKNANGQALLMIAQLNLAQMPELPDYPKQGLLQFFVDAHHDLWGMNFDDLGNQQGFRVVYYPEIIEDMNQLVQDFDFLPDLSQQDIYTPLSSVESYDDEYAIEFEAKTDVILPSSDYQFDTLFSELSETMWDDDDLGEAICDELGCQGSRVGGYPHFTQDDRRYNEKYQDYILLFQLDSDNDINNKENVMMWGDSGVANFFIRPDDLKKGDFSQTLFTWDCY